MIKISIMLIVLYNVCACASLPEYKSGWLFQINRTMNDENVIISQLFKADETDLRNAEKCGKILRKFISKMINEDTLQVMAHTGDGKSGASRYILEVKAKDGEYILIRGNNVYDGNKTISGIEIESEFNKLINEGIDAMKSQEEIEAKIKTR